MVIQQVKMDYNANKITITAVNLFLKSYSEELNFFSLRRNIFLLSMIKFVPVRVNHNQHCTSPYVARILSACEKTRFHA